MSTFRFYRKLLGGTWYQNRYIFDAGRVVIFAWERKQKDNGWGGYTVDTEKY